MIAFVLFILDIKAPTHGALTAAGTGSFIAGALILFNSIQVPGFAKGVGRVGDWRVALFIGLTFFAIVMIAMRAMKKPIITGRESIHGKTGICISRLDPTGIVQVAGEQWSAQLDKGQTPLKKGDRVVVVQVEGVRLIVHGD